MTIYFDSTARKARDLPMSEAERAARAQLAACCRIFHHLGWTEMIFNHITLRVPGPGAKRTCADVFAAMVRLVEAKDPSYRD